MDADFRNDCPFELECGADNLPRFATRAGTLTAVDASAYVLAAVREMRPPARVCHYFGREPLASLPPDHLVAIGAATWL